MSDKVTFKNINFKSNLTKSLWSAYNSQKLVDVMFNCNGVIVAVHRLVLEMMAPNILKCLTDSSSTCCVDIDPAIFKYLVEYIYTGQVAVFRSQIEEFQIGAIKLGLTALVEGIISYTRGLTATLLTEDSPTSLWKASQIEHNFSEISGSLETRILDEGEVTQLTLEFTNDQVLDTLLNLEPVNDALKDENENVAEDEFDLTKHSYSLKISQMAKMKCNQCDYETIDSQAYLKHTNDDHVKVASEIFEPRKYVCYRCDFVCNEKRLLVLHRKKEHGTFKRIFRCQFCGFIGESYLLLGRHIQNNHSQDRPHHCPNCDYKSRTSGDLRKHMVCHTEDKVECHLCGKWLRDKRSFKAHLKVHNEGGKPKTKIRHGCNMCSYTCSRKVILVNHLKVVHDVEYFEPLSKSTIPGRLPTGEFQCQHCQYKTRDRKLYCHHLGIKHNVDEEGNPAIPKYQCKQCEFKALTYLQLVNHAQFKHPKTIYICQHCPFTTGHRISFTYHMQNKHSYPKPFSCDKCGLQCGSLALARRHALTHVNQKFICPICHNSYAQKIYLRRHIRIMHNADGPTVMCHMCPFKTRTNDALKQHIKRMHSDEKPPPRIRRKQD